jgi:hypothetical protein
VNDLKCISGIPVLAGKEKPKFQTKNILVGKFGVLVLMVDIRHFEERVPLLEGYRSPPAGICGNQ